MVVAALSVLAVMLSIALAVQTSRLRRALPPGEWRIAGMSLPAPDDPGWERASYGGYGLEGLELGVTRVTCDCDGDGKVYVADMVVGSWKRHPREATAYARAVLGAYANRKALEALTS